MRETERSIAEQISIHALRKESDLKRSTVSGLTPYFNPRSP